MWKVVLCASLVVIVAAENLASAEATSFENTDSLGKTGETSETGETGETGVTGDTGDTGATADTLEYQSNGDSDASCGRRCGKDQVYTDFKDRGCTPLRCSELGFPINATKTCKPGCVCKDSLLFADDGTCVSRDRCPSCGGDPNAEPGCGSNCGKTCATYKNKPLRCPIGCIFNGCNCKDGFVFDPNVKKCVLPKQCTPQCGKNEIFSNCTNGGCDARNCSQVGKPVPCVKLDPKYCIKGCLCASGFLRAANGTCVPKDQCDQGCGGDLNAQPGCGVNCGRTCETYKNKPVVCPLICRLNGCDCKPGFVFDSTVNKCVLPQDCTPKCAQNEIASNCSNGGCGPFTCSDVGNPVKCVRPAQCEKGCVCQKTYVRADNGTCVPKNQCPGRRCGKDQVYTDFKDRGCTPLRCSELGFPINATKTCKPGCVCKDSLLFADDGTCVSRDRCPSCGGDPNAEPGCGSNCGKTCATYKNKPLRCPIGCIFNGCNCKDGFVFDPNVKKCVLPKQCTPQCGKNEIFSNCTNGGCDARNCSQVGKPVPCVKLDPKYCIKGCVCASGFLRAANGTCLPKDQCDHGCGGDLNAQPGCGVNCGRTCETYKNKPVVCPLICRLNGCDCKPGFVFDSTVNKCVLPQDCTPKCGQNEIASNCSNGGCGPFTCSDVGNPVKCVRPAQCEKGCVCQKTYVRADNGTCVPKNQCPAKCPKNEVFDLCPAPCPPRRCDVDDRLIFCPASPKPGSPNCKPACRCVDNYKRNSKGICVPRSQCDNTPKCGKKEIFSNCTNGGCDARNCSQVGKPVPCVKLDPKYCIKGCICKSGFLRAANGTCVPKDQCDQATPPCPEGEVYSRCPTVKCEGDYCPKNKDSPLRCPVGIVCDPPRCICGFNRRRDRNTGKCILSSNCPPIPCDKNEKYKSCPASCPGEQCSDYINDTKCPSYKIGYVVPCEPKCKCKKGYYRNKDGVCIIGAQCEKCPQNEVFDICPAPCPPRRCDVDDRLIRCAAPPSPGSPDCKPACRCVDNYARNSKGICVPRSQCDNPPKCGKNEIFSNCTNGGCDARNCSQVGKPVPCVKLDPKYCIKGCICKSGFLRAANGTCVPKDQCDQAKPGCGVNCGKTCSTYKTKAPICPRICKVNGCDCIDGYVLDPNVGKCVLPKDCTPTCGLNEVYTTCVNGGCGHRNCSQLGGPILCIDPLKCIGGCTCQPNYLRAANGTCVPEDQCNQPKCPQNEVFDVCPAPCPPRRCDVDDRLIRCAAPPSPGSPDCKPACRCVDNYARNSKGICVPRSQCDNPNSQCTGQNEYFEKCISGCSNQTCKDIGKIYPCPLQAVCRSGCRCNPGFWRDLNGVCIPESACPTPPCPEGEVYSRCPTVKCEGDYCPKNKDSPLSCPVGIVCDPPRCICGFNRRRDRNTGKCILSSNCPPIPCDKNEEYNSCPASCPGEQCSDYINDTKCPPYRIGIVVPCEPKCKCKKGYYRNKDGVCIIGAQCASKCGKNEIFSNCTNGGCDARNCSQVGKPVPCVKLDPKYCIKGCICKSGFLRAANGTCVPKDQCDQEKCPRNEVFDVCPAPCPPRRCDVDDRLIDCAPPPKPGSPNCKPACRCVDNYKRNSKGICVPRSQCDNTSAPCSGPNEVVNMCLSGRPSNQTCNDIGKVVECPIQPAICRIGCVCKPGCWRNADNVCIPENECPNSQCTGQNEYFEKCISGCSNQTCSDIGKIYKCPLQPAVCRSGCRCNPGFWRDSNGVCIPESACPTPPCPEGEVYSRCPTVKCEGDYCPKNKDSPLRCPVGIVCDPPRCICGFNRRRDRNTGKCIFSSNCPPIPCDKNEEYNSCPASCPGEQCSDYINDTKCPPYRIGIVVPCEPKCKCKKGYYRNKDGVCIIGAQCGPKNSTVITTTNNNTTSTADGIASLKAAVTSATGKALVSRMKSAKGENLIMSIFSVFTPLAELALYAVGVSLQQLLAVLNLKNKDDIRTVFPAWTASFENHTGGEFASTSKVYSSKTYALSDEFKKDLVDIFHAEGQDLDFSNPEQAAAIINAWVESKTNNRIKDLVSPDMLNKLTRMVLVNAIYFKYNWLYQFNVNNTLDNQDFYLSDGTTKKTKLMYQEATFNYGEDDDCKYLEMLYADKQYSMFIALPKKVEGVADLAEKLSDPTNYNKAYSSLRSQKVKVWLPPWKTETTTDLKDLLAQLGVTKIFDASDSGLKGLFKKMDAAYVSAAIQKAYIEVNEEGSEAAAANGIIVRPPRPGPPPPPPNEFRADHSFLFYIRANGTAIFSGTKCQ